MKILLMLIGGIALAFAEGKTNFWDVLYKDYSVNKSSGSESIRSHCGRNTYNNGVLKRIVGGLESKKAEWPWLVSLLLWREDKMLKNKFNVEHFCGGTLISQSWILTAAHCFEKRWSSLLSDDPRKWTARLGEHDLLKVESHQIDHEIQAIFIHKNRLSDNMDNDIALVKLKNAARFNKYVKPACLPYPTETFYEKMICTTAGWGHTSYNGSLATIIRHVGLELINFGDCKEQYDIISLMLKSDIYKIKPTMMCAGNEEGKDACQYDSGGPLLCKSSIDNTWIASGIVSFGFGCGWKIPGIYTRVTSYLNWIQNIISKN